EVPSVPGLADALGVASLVVHQYHLELSIGAFGEENVAARGEVAAHVLLLQRDALQLLGGLLICLALSLAGPAEHTAARADRRATHRARPPLPGAGTGDRSEPSPNRAGRAPADGSAGKRGFKFTGSPRLPRGLPRRKRSYSFTHVVDGENLTRHDRARLIGA